MNITFVVTDQQKAHEGVVRPFLNFAKGIENKCQISFFLLNCGRSFSDYLKKTSIPVFESKSKNETIEKMRSIKPDFIFVDDDLERLRLVQKIKKVIDAKSVSYVQILYGSHCISNCFDTDSLTYREKLVYNSTRYLPFFFFRNRYIKLLNSFDLVIANSSVTATFLHSIYGVEVTGIIYPPVDIEIFKPIVPKSKSEVTLYLGSHLGDTKKEFAKKIVAKASEEDFIINLFGNSQMALGISYKREDRVLYHSDLTDKELAKLYSKSKLTICPQKWEQFGFVPVESMACGTPVLAFNCMGFQETVDKSAGWLVNNEEDFLCTLGKLLRKNSLPAETRNRAIQQFSIETSSKSLIELLEKYFS